MDREDLNFILQEGEGHKIEFKERSSTLDREMVAFANAQGGRILLGINDDNQIVGVSVTNRLKSSIRDIARNCDPPIEIRFDEQINRRFRYPTDKSPDRLQAYLERIGVRTDTAPEKVLLNLDVAERDAPLLFKNAGVMFFAREPARFIPHN